jgi:hypothetical protein
VIGIPRATKERGEYYLAGCPQSRFNSPVRMQCMLVTIYLVYSCKRTTRDIEYVLQRSPGSFPSH